jgi:hypothetical protein
MTRSHRLCSRTYLVYLLIRFAHTSYRRFIAYVISLNAQRTLETVDDRQEGTVEIKCINVRRNTTNIYNRKTKGPTLMGLFTATGK